MLAESLNNPNYRLRTKFKENFDFKADGSASIDLSALMLHFFQREKGTGLTELNDFLEERRSAASAGSSRPLLNPPPLGDDTDDRDEAKIEESVVEDDEAYERRNSADEPMIRKALERRAAGKTAEASESI